MCLQGVKNIFIEKKKLHHLQVQATRVRENYGLFQKVISE